MNKFAKLKKENHKSKSEKGKKTGQWKKMNINMGPPHKIGILIIVVALLAGGFGLWWQNQVPPEAAAKKAIEDTINASSYTYHAMSNRIIEENVEPLSEIWGESNQGSVHLLGQIHVANAQFEIYQIEDKFYRQDSITKEWLVVEGDNIQATETLIQEVNPLGAFAFSDNFDAEYIGREKVGGARCKKYQIMADNENPYLANLWQDFYYTIWVDRKGHLRQAEIIAVNKDNPEQKLNMVVQFSINPDAEEIIAPI